MKHRMPVTPLTKVELENQALEDQKFFPDIGGLSSLTSFQGSKDDPFGPKYKDLM